MSGENSKQLIVKFSLLCCLFGLTYGGPEYFLRTPFNFGIEYYNNSYLNINSEIGFGVSYLAKYVGDYDYIFQTDPSNSSINPISFDFLFNENINTFLMQLGLQVNHSHLFVAPFINLGYKWKLITNNWKISPEMRVINSGYYFYNGRYNFHAYPSISIKFTKTKVKENRDYQAGGDGKIGINLFASLPLSSGLYYELSNYLRISTTVDYKIPEKLMKYPQGVEYEQEGGFTYWPVGMDLGCFHCKSSLVLKNQLGVYSFETMRNRREGINPDDFLLRSNLIYQGNFNLNRFGLEPFFNIAAFEYFPGKQFHQFKSNPSVGMNVTYSLVSDKKVNEVTK